MAQGLDWTMMNWSATVKGNDVSKFNSKLAEAAYMVAGDGFAEQEHGSVESPDGWNGLVPVSSVTLLNLGVDEYFIYAVEKEVPAVKDSDLLVWLHEDSDGFVNVLSSGSGPDVETAWNRLMEGAC